MSGSITFRVGSVNAMSLPQHWKLMRVFASTVGLHVIGMQEMDPPRYKRAAKKRWPQILGLGPIDDNTYSCPLVFARKRFSVVSSKSVKLYTGSEGISYTRHLTRAILSEKKTGIQLGVINLHGPVVKKDKKLAKRLACRAQAKKIACRQVDLFLRLGLPVVVTGDFNDKANWFKKYNAKRVGGGIDQILLIGNKNTSWEVLSKSSVDTPSDHNTLRSRVRLVVV